MYNILNEKIYEKSVSYTCDVSEKDNIIHVCMKFSLGNQQKKHNVTTPDGVVVEESYVACEDSLKKQQICDFVKKHYVNDM